MSVLFPHLPFDRTEIPLSYATRLAAFHIGASLVPFLKDIGVQADALRQGDTEAITCLADISGADRAALERNTVRSITKHSFRLRGHDLSAGFFAGPATILCSACLREDGIGHHGVASNRRGRLDWTLGPVRTCARYNLGLVRRKWQPSDGRYHELAAIVPERGEDLDRLVDEAPLRAPSPLQIYVTDRLDGAQGPSWLDRENLEQAVRATEMFGMLISFGSKKRPVEMTSDDWDAAGRAGFEVTSAGEEAIRNALADVQTACRGKGAKPGCREVFGATYDWLSNKRKRRDAGDITRILRDHVFATMEVAPGQEILGVSLAERRLHSVQSLARETGLNHRTLRNILAARGLLPVEDKISGYHIFDAGVGRKVAASVRRVTRVVSLGKALGCTRPLAEHLIDERLLTPIVDRQGAAIGHTSKGVEDREITRFLGVLHDEALPVDATPPGMVPIATEAKKAQVPNVETVHLILGGFLEEVVRLKGVEGCAAILVDPQEVREQSRVLIGLSATAAFGALKIPTSTGWALVDRDQEPTLAAVTISGPNGRHHVQRFTPEAVFDFASKFATVSYLAEETGIWRNDIAACFGKLGQ